MCRSICSATSFFLYIHILSRIVIGFDIQFTVQKPVLFDLSACCAIAVSKHRVKKVHMFDIVYGGGGEEGNMSSLLFVVFINACLSHFMLVMKKQHMVKQLTSLAIVLRSL